MSGLYRKSFTYFSDTKFVLISEIRVQMESACRFKVILKSKIKYKELLSSGLPKTEKSREVQHK